MEEELLEFDAIGVGYVNGVLMTDREVLRIEETRGISIICTIYRWNKFLPGIELAGVPIGRFFAVRAKAIEVATQAAQFENREGRSAVVYSLGEDLKRVVEWSA